MSLCRVLQDQRLSDAQWVVSEMSAAGLTPDASRLALLSSAFDLAGRKSEAAHFRSLLRNLQQKLQPQQQQQQAQHVASGPSRPVMTSPLLRVWSSDDNVAQLIEAVTASKVCGVCSPACIVRCRCLRGGLPPPSMRMVCTY